MGWRNGRGGERKYQIYALSSGSFPGTVQFAIYGDDENCWDDPCGAERERGEGGSVVGFLGCEAEIDAADAAFGDVDGD